MDRLVAWYITKFKIISFWVISGPSDQWPSGLVDQWPISAFPHRMMMNVCTAQQLSVSKFHDDRLLTTTPLNSSECQNPEWFSIIWLVLRVRYEVGWVSGVNIWASLADVAWDDDIGCDGIMTDGISLRFLVRTQPQPMLLTPSASSNSTQTPPNKSYTE